VIPTWVIALIGGLAAAGITATAGLPTPPGLDTAIQNITQHAPQTIGTQHAVNILKTLVNGSVGAGISGGVSAVAKTLAKAFTKTAS
jgi:hypothetical protein